MIINETLFNFILSFTLFSSLNSLEASVGIPIVFSAIILGHQPINTFGALSGCFLSMTFTKITQLEKQSILSPITSFILMMFMPLSEQFIIFYVLFLDKYIYRQNWDYVMFKCAFYTLIILLKNNYFLDDNYMLNFTIFLISSITTVVLTKINK